VLVLSIVVGLVWYRGIAARDEHRHVSIVLLGVGQVARAFVEQVVAGRDIWSERYGVTVQIESVSDRSGVLTSGQYLDDATLQAILKSKSEGLSLREMHNRGWPHRRATAAIHDGLDPGMLTAIRYESRDGGRSARRVVVDLTAANTTELLIQARSNGAGVVIANKLPVTASMSQYRRLTMATSAPYDSRFRYETTVGAALPVIATLSSLVASLDRLEQVQGCFSGTLG
jgi:homoserine dehydrogenase